MQRVLIIGGGYAGVILAKALDAAFHVVLLERKDRFYHNVGALRAYANPAYFDSLLLPYNRLLKNGRVIQEEAQTVGPGHVRTTEGTVWEADIIVVATGSRHLLPFKSEFRQSAAFLAEAQACASQLADAPSVAILGDGPVAVELAGEISARYPTKVIQLISPHLRLLASAGNPKLGLRVQQLLQQRGVEVRSTPQADLIIQAYGAETSVPCLGQPGRVRVDGHFQVPGRQGVYALGDAADCGEPQLTFLARRQALYLAQHLQRPARPYQPARRIAMSIPLGPNEGATQLPLPGLPIVGNWLTSRLKGRDLFLANNRQLLGLPNK